MEVTARWLGDKRLGSKLMDCYLVRKGARSPQFQLHLQLNPEEEDDAAALECIQELLPGVEVSL